MKAIILSAGQGKRLFPLTRKLPKCLVDIRGRSILEWQIEVLRFCGIESIIVVTGFMHEKVEGILTSRYSSKHIQALYNPEFAKADNLFSCWKASKQMTEDFILLNGDTLFEPDVLKKLLSMASGDITITINRKDRYDADDMKVMIQSDRLVRVGKDLDAHMVNGESIGLSFFKQKGPYIFKKALDEAVKESGAAKRWYLSVIDKLAQKGLVHVVDISGLAWCEIDFPRDLKSAEGVVSVIEDALFAQDHGHLSSNSYKATARAMIRK